MCRWSLTLTSVPGWRASSAARIRSDATHRRGPAKRRLIATQRCEVFHHARTPSNFALAPRRKSLQEKVGVAERMEQFGQKVIRDYMPDQHRQFYHQLPFMVAGTVDAQGRPWATLLEGPEGFVTSPEPRQLVISATPAADDPAASGIAAGQSIGLLGIELHTRRRNRINGQISLGAAGQLLVEVEQSFGNCPQYIQLRDYRRVDEPAMPREDSTILDARATAMIESADTFLSQATSITTTLSVRWMSRTAEVAQASSRSRAIA